MLLNTEYLMVWLKSSKSQLSKTFFLQIENQLNIKKVMSKNVCVCVLFPSLTSLTSIALQSLGVIDLSLTSSTCFYIHSI